VSWQTVLVLVAAGLLLVGVLVFVLAYRSVKKKLQAALVDVVRLQGDLDAALDDVARLLDLVENARLSDADAIKKLRARLQGWRAVDGRDPVVAGGGGGAAGGG
jgi:hypothetical protein